METNRKLGLAEDVKIDVHIAIELPDYPICLPWRAWYKSQGIVDAVAVKITSRRTWDGRKDDLKDTLTSLLVEGRPKMIWSFVYVPAQ